jgi:hypothetical protein
MTAGLHVVGWGLSRLAVAAGAAAVFVVLAYSTLIFGIVVVQAVASFNT